MDKDQLEGNFIELDHDEQTDSEFDEDDYFSCSDEECSDGEYLEPIEEFSYYPDIGLVDISGRKLYKLDMKALRICKKDEIFMAKTKELVDIMSSGSELESEDEEVEVNNSSNYWANFYDKYNRGALLRAVTFKRIEKKIDKNTKIISVLTALTIRPKYEITEEKRARKKAFKEYRKERAREKKRK